MTINYSTSAFGHGVFKIVRDKIAMYVQRRDLKSSKDEVGHWERSSLTYLIAPFRLTNYSAADYSVRGEAVLTPSDLVSDRRIFFLLTVRTCSFRDTRQFTDVFWVITAMSRFFRCTRKDFAERFKILLDTDQKIIFVRLSK